MGHVHIGSPLIPNVTVFFYEYFDCVRELIFLSPWKLLTRLKPFLLLCSSIPNSNPNPNPNPNPYRKTFKKVFVVACGGVP